MKLLYSPGSCAFSVHVLFEELGIQYESQSVDIHKKGPDLLKYNAFGYVPVLIKDNGEVMTEAIAILQYIAQLNQKTSVVPTTGSEDWGRCLMWMSFASSELHQKIGPLFQREKLSKEALKELEAKIESRIGHVDSYLTNKKFLVGDDFTIADMYMLAILRIAEHVKVPLKKFAALTRYKEMLGMMPSVKRADEIEKKQTGLKKSA